MVPSAGKHMHIDYREGVTTIWGATVCVPGGLGWRGAGYGGGSVYTTRGQKVKSVGIVERKIEVNV